MHLSETELISCTTWLIDNGVKCGTSLICIRIFFHRLWVKNIQHSMSRAHLKTKAACFWHPVLCFILNDDGNSSNTYQWYFANELFSTFPAHSFVHSLWTQQFPSAEPLCVLKIRCCYIAKWFIKVNYYFLPEIFLIRLEYGRYLGATLNSHLSLFFRVFGHLLGSDALSDPHDMPTLRLRPTMVLTFVPWWVITVLSYFLSVVSNNSVFIFSCFNE